jgi:hypothetical protein
MTGRYRYIDFQRSLDGGAAAVSARLLSQEPERDAAGHIVRLRTARPSFTPREIARLFQPYVSQRFLDQFKTVAPLAAYLVLFQLLVLRELVQDSWLITGGLLAVILGLMFFMEGLKLGLMPFGTVIGATLPRKSSLPVVLIITLLLGIGVTFAEPAISALKMAGQNVAVERAPYLYALLNEWAGALVLVVGASVGLAAVVGTLRFLYGWSLKTLIYLSLAPVLSLTVYAALRPELAKALGLAWDTGGVTTGPVTVPLVLSLGIGIAAAAGKADSGLSGFGTVTLASLFPVGGVLLRSSAPSRSQPPPMRPKLRRGRRRPGTSAARRWRSYLASVRFCRWWCSCSWSCPPCSARNCPIAARFSSALPSLSSACAFSTSA